MDSSIKFQSGHITDLQDISLRSDGVCPFFGAGASVFAVLPPEMFRHLPMLNDPKKNGCLQASQLLLYRTKFVKDNVLHWWVACALSPTCIYSEPNRHCKFSREKYKKFAFCSRYDQSALSIILYNAYPDLKQAIGPTPSKSGKIDIIRGGNLETIKNC